MRAMITILTLFTILLGGIYPMVVYGIAEAVFSFTANGSLVQKNEKVIGSSLIGQEFSDAKYFIGRPSATQPAYNANASVGSNFSPANSKQVDAVKARITAWQKLDPKNDQPVPVELVTASASGLDPHISFEAAAYQVQRVARVRKLDEEKVNKLVSLHREQPMFGLLGTEVVNVLKLNMALDELASDKRP